MVPAVKRGFEMGPGGNRATSNSSAARPRRRVPRSGSISAQDARCAGSDCPDECFDPTTDGFYDVNYEYCVGCGKCAEVCPVKECIVMVDELQVRRQQQSVGALEERPKEYIAWVEEKKGKDRFSYPVRHRNRHYRHPGRSDARGKDRTRQKDGGG